MKKQIILFILTAMAISAIAQINSNIPPQYNITLKQAHIGSLEIDSLLLNSYGNVSQNVQQFYFDARKVFKEGNADFTNETIIASAQRNSMLLMGGPMLGKVSANEVSLWIRASKATPLKIKVSALSGGKTKTFKLNEIIPGKDYRISLNGLTSGCKYSYVVYSGKDKAAEGTFKTTQMSKDKREVRIAFGSCFHKLGLHNPNLINTILDRKPEAMLLLGDIAVDDRENNISMHRSDYLLRDMSPAWQQLAANVPLYTSWDDHDYLNNDLSGIPSRFAVCDMENLREVWEQNWNNPQNSKDGIYFNTLIGNVEVIMLDTRSCRKVNERGNNTSYLGTEQQEWLKQTLANSTATFKVISSGTMWSDYVTKAKDSWGTWDIEARNEIFNLIEKENIPGVLFISGDRHGARGFTIPRKSGFKFYEFEAASLGGVPGPPAMANDTSNQLFGYKGLGLKAFGEFTFCFNNDMPKVTFRLINESGKIMEEHILTYKMLTPIKQ